MSCNDNAENPVKVFIMLGQSNMLGFGRVGPKDQQGTLEYLVQSGLYRHHMDEQGRWKSNQKVRFVQVMHANGKPSVLRNEWLTIQGKHVGPELEFGHVLGNALSEDGPILLLKSCTGNRSLGWDLLPPGSDSYVHKGITYAGYKDSPASWEAGTTPQPIEWYAGKQYDDDVASAKEVLKNIGIYYPGKKTYEVSGFVWWQGHKDGQCEAHAIRYQHNMRVLIRQLRIDFQCPTAKFVMATVAFDGANMKGNMLTVCRAQMAAVKDHNDGTVACVDARPYWRDASVSPSRQGHHYNHNAETYLRVGHDLGEAMVELMKQQSTPTTLTTVTSFSEELRLLAGNQWKRVVTHRFTTELASGTIDRNVLKCYLIQDHRFLDSFVCLLASMVASARCLEDRVEGCQFLSLLTGKENTYFARSFDHLGISAEDREAIPDASVTRRFIDLMNSVTKEGTLGERLAILLVCEWTYLSWGQLVQGETVRDNFVCYEWVDLHCGDYFESVISYLRRLLDQEGARLDGDGRDACRRRFLEAVQLEEEFFEFVYKK